MFARIVFALFVSVLSLSASAQWGGYGFTGYGQDRQMSAQQYGNQNALRLGDAIEVEVLSVRNVRIQPNNSNGRQMAIAGAGSAIGGIAANQLASKASSGVRTAASIAGALIGGIGGAALSQPSLVPAQELAIRKVGESKVLVVVQAESDFRVGEHALAIQVGGEYRVARMYNDQPAVRAEPIARNSFSESSGF